MMKQKLFFMLLALTQAKFMSEREVDKLRNTYTQNLPLLVTSTDKDLIKNSIQQEYEELFGESMQATSLLAALQNYRNADLDQLSGPFNGVNSHEQLKQKFNEVIKNDIQTQFENNTNVQNADVDNYYQHVLPLIKQYYAAVMKVNIATKDTTLETEAKVSSLLIDHVAQNQVNKESISQLENEIENLQDKLENYLYNDYSEKAKYFIRNQVENFVDFAYKIQVMAQEVTRGRNKTQSKQFQQAFRNTISKSLSLLTVLFEANESGDEEHLINRKNNNDQSQQTINRERKDYLFQTLADEREYLMKQQKDQIENQQLYGVFFSELVKKTIEIDSNPQDAVYMKQYMSHSNPITNNTFEAILDAKLQEVVEVIKSQEKLQGEELRIITLKIADQIAFNKNISNDAVQQFRSFYSEVVTISAPYMNNSTFLFFISDAGCHGDENVNNALYDALTLFRTKYTLATTTTNKYAIAMFFNQFLDDLNDKYSSQESTEQTVKFQNYYFYLKYQVMIQMAAFVPENVDGLFYFKPLSEQQEEFINTNINKLCIEKEKREQEDAGKKKFFLSTLNGLVYYVIGQQLKAKQILGFLTNKGVEEKDKFVGVDLKKVREVYTIEVESSEQLSSDILEKISKPQEFMMQAQLNQDTFQKMQFEPSVQQSSEQVIDIDHQSSIESSEESQDLSDNISVTKKQSSQEDLIEDDVSEVQYNDPNGKNIVKVIYGEIDEEELAIFEDQRVIELLQGDESQNLMNRTDQDGSYIDASFVRIIPHNSPCQDE